MTLPPEQHMEKNHALFWRIMFHMVKDFVDISSLCDDHPLFIYNADRMDSLRTYRQNNFKKLGLFKSECGTHNLTIVAGIFLKAKLYAIKNQDESEKLRAKGITRGQKKTSLSFERYRQIAVGNLDFIFVPQYTFRSHLHEIYTTYVQKLAISCVEIKKYWINRFESIPYEDQFSLESTPNPSSSSSSSSFSSSAAYSFSYPVDPISLTPIEGKFLEEEDEGKEVE